MDDHGKRMRDPASQEALKAAEAAGAPTALDSMIRSSRPAGSAGKGFAAGSAIWGPAALVRPPKVSALESAARTPIPLQRETCFA